MTYKIITSSGRMDLTVPTNKKDSQKGEVRIACPICSPSRKPEHRKEEVLSVNRKKKKWRCNHCGESGYLLNEDEARKTHDIIPLKKDIPVLTMNTQDDIIRWFYKERNISPTTVSYFKVKKVKKKFKDRKTRESLLKTAIMFPSYDGTDLIDVQYRSMDKEFSSEEGAVKIPFNINAVKYSENCIITEGRIDTMSVYEAGIPIPSISVPNGVALSESEASEFKNTGHIEMPNQINLNYIDLYWQYFKDKKLIIIGTDIDAAGYKLREELARRFGKHRCKYLDWSLVTKKDGTPCKDANDVLVHGGVEKLRWVYENAKNFPIQGVVTINDVWEEIEKQYNEGLKKGLSTGFKSLDPHFTIMPGHTVVFNGHRSQGKTTFLFNILANTALMYNWRAGFYTPENYPVSHVYNTLLEIIIGNTVDIDYKDRAKKSEIMDAKNIINDYFYVVEDDNIGGYTPDKLRDKAGEMIAKYGIKVFAKDPWNNLIENRRNNQGIDNFLSEQLGKENRFAKLNDVYNIICAHPKTPKQLSHGELYPPSDQELYGGNIWSAKVHEILTVHRSSADVNDKKTMIFVNKVKDHKLIGKPTEMSHHVPLYFRFRNNRFGYQDVDGRTYYPLDKIMGEKQEQLSLFAV